MSYHFQSMTDEELEQLLDDGVYDFEVKQSERKISSSNNPMAKLILTVWDNKGIEKTIYDYLVFSTVPLNIKKVKHFCDAVGLQEEYKKGTLPEELSKLSGKVEIGKQEEQPKDGGGYWPPKNVVIDYVMTDKGAVKVPTSKTNEDDEIPF